jgi:hypothetical protein
LKFEFCSGLSLLLCGLFVSELVQGDGVFVKFEVRGGVVNTTLSCYDVIIDRDSVKRKAVISSSFPPVTNSTDCFPLFVTATIPNYDFKYKCLVINNGSHYETCYVLEAHSIFFHIVSLSNVSSLGNSPKIVWNVECFVTLISVIIFRHVCKISKSDY